MRSMITGYTRLVGLLGYPIKHSKSPRMHNLSFGQLGVDAVYLTFDVEQSNLADAIKAMRTLNVLGFNVTMPNKQAVIPLLDELSEEARLIGAVNTVSNVDGVLKGYNTDGIGFVRNLNEHNIDYKTVKVVVGGAGGAGSAVAIQMALCDTPEMVIFDGNLEAAERLAKNINDNIKTCKATARLMNEADLVEELKTAGLYVDATPLGMAPLEDKAVISSPDQLPKDIVVTDLTYVPLKTKLLQMAEERGCKIVTGIGMMYHQGAEAERIWVDKEMPMDYIKENL